MFHFYLVIMNDKISEEETSKKSIVYRLSNNVIQLGKSWLF